MATTQPHRIIRAFLSDTAPDNNTDATQGYRESDIIVDTSGGISYICEDASDGAAIWTSIVAAGAAPDLSGLSIVTPPATTDYATYYDVADADTYRCTIADFLSSGQVVTAAAVLTNNALIKGSGGARGSATTPVIVDASGYVGIGLTPAPAGVLEVLKIGAGVPQLRLTDTQGSLYTDFRCNTAGEFYMQTAGQKFGFLRGSTTLLNAFFGIKNVADEDTYIDLLGGSTALYDLYLRWRSFGTGGGVLFSMGRSDVGNFIQYDATTGSHFLVKIAQASGAGRLCLCASGAEPIRFNWTTLDGNASTGGTEWYDGSTTRVKIASLTGTDAGADVAFDISGNITLTGTVDGRDVATDGTKLDGVEALADVTDATNVAAAGAVMDGDFGSDGFMQRSGGAGSYAVVADPLPIANGGTALAAAPTNSILLLSSGGHGTVTAGAGNSGAPEQGETTTNKVNYWYLAFDPSTAESAFWIFPMPDRWNAGTITARFYWTAASGSGGVVWGIKGISFADSDALDTAFGTEQTVADTLLTAGDVHTTSATSAMTLAGGPAAGELINLVVTRKTADGSDTLAVDARLIGVLLEFGTTGYTD